MLNAALIIAGLTGIAVAILGKTFYSSNVEAGSNNDEKPASVWSGRLVFGVVGIGLVFVGIMKLLGR